MVCCSSMSRSSEIGEWSGRSSNSASSNIIYATSASKLPILKLNAEGYCKLSQHQKGGWSSPILNILCQTSASSLALNPKEGEIIKGTTSNGMAWTPSRWGHLV
jgi:hypothetical protein